MGILLGVALLLCVQNIIAWGMLLKFMLSAVLVIIGLNIIFKDVAWSDVSQKIQSLNKEKTWENKICATFSGQDVKQDVGQVWRRRHRRNIWRSR